MASKLLPRRGDRRTHLRDRARARPRPHDEPLVLLPLRAQDLGRRARRAGGHGRGAAHREQLDSEDPDEGRAPDPGVQAGQRQRLLLSAQGLRPDQRSRCAPPPSGTAPSSCSARASSRIVHDDRPRAGGAVREGRAAPWSLPVDAAWSTLPIGLLVRLLSPAAPPEVIAAANATRFRGMILIYLVLEQDQFTEFDAHYFPEASIPMARMSEPKNYSVAAEPQGTDGAVRRTSERSRRGDLGAVRCRTRAADVPAGSPTPACRSRRACARS